MVKVLFALLVMLFTSLSCYASEEPYYAVLAGPDLVHDFKNAWHYDKFAILHNWRELDDYLIVIAKASNGRKVILDLACHGNTNGLLVLVNGEKLSYATMGAFLNHVETYLDTSRLVVITEACYAGRCYVRSLRNIQLLTRINDLGGVHDEVPTYPVYGVANHQNLNSLTLVQYIKKNYVYIMDLRKFEKEELPEQDSEVMVQKLRGYEVVMNAEYRRRFLQTK